MMSFRMDTVCHGITGVILGAKVFITLLSCTDVHNENTHTHTLTVSAVCSILTSTLAVYLSLEVADLCCLNFDSKTQTLQERAE